MQNYPQSTCKFALAVAAVLPLGCPAWAAAPASITIRADKPGARIGPLFYGLMTEEFDHSYDGGTGEPHRFGAPLQAGYHVGGIHRAAHQGDQRHRAWPPRRKGARHILLGAGQRRSWRSRGVRTQWSDETGDRKLHGTRHSASEVGQSSTGRSQLLKADCRAHPAFDTAAHRTDLFDRCCSQ